MTIEVIRELVECMEAAIQSGDWKVDGACDPTLVLLRARKAIAELEKEEPIAMWDGKYQVEFGNLSAYKLEKHNWVPLYTHPQPKSEGISLMPIKHPVGPKWDGDINPDSLEEIEIDLPKREWVGLTDTEIKRIGKLDWDSNYVGLWYDFAKAIEAKLKEKNT